jgi:toxin ParE1/3/4
MADCRLSSQADADLSGIADYTIEAFGIEQARRYQDGLQAGFQILADNPLLGQNADYLAPNLRCIEHQSHVIYYMPQEHGVLIVRILHASMEATGHLGYLIAE